MYMVKQMKFVRALIVAVIFLVLTSCSHKLATRDSAPEKPAGPAAAVQTSAHEGVGTIKAIKPKMPSIEIDHGDISGLMPAMQMEFKVKDGSLLDGLAVGDKIAFTVTNGVGGMLITSIKKV